MNSVLNKILIFLSVLILLIGFFISSFFIPVYAVSSVTVYNSIPTSSDLESTGLLLYTDSNGSTFVGANNDTVRVGGYKSGNYTYLAAATDDKTSLVYILGTNGTVSSSNYQYNSLESGLYVNTIGISTSNTDTFNVTVYDSKADFLADYNNIDNIEPTVYPALYDGLSIPRGYLALIEFNDDIPQGAYLSFYSTFNRMSNLFTGTWKNTSQWSNYYNIGSVPTISNIISSGGSQINWTSTGDGNILGQSKSGYFSTNSIGAYNVFCICNSVYTDSSVNLTNLNYDYNGDLNSSITISDPDGYIKKVRLYALSSSLDRLTGDISNSLSVDSQSYNVQGSTSGAFTYEVIGTSSTAISPAENGGTYVDSQNYSTSDIIGTVNNGFANLINRLENIFHPGASYFNTLIGSASSFVSWMAQLWSWLPNPIVGLIESVLYVSILVGCIKLLF